MGEDVTEVVSRLRDARKRLVDTAGKDIYNELKGHMDQHVVEAMALVASECAGIGFDVGVNAASAELDQAIKGRKESVKR